MAADDGKGLPLLGLLVAWLVAESKEQGVTTPNQGCGQQKHPNRKLPFGSHTKSGAAEGEDCHIVVWREINHNSCLWLSNAKASCVTRKNIANANWQLVEHGIVC